MSKNEFLRQFMEQFPHEGLTFDDVSLITQYADFLPTDTDISSRLTERIVVVSPYLSAAMDTVTESEMGIAMAMIGGIGVIHKNLDPKRQAKEVGRVKHYLNRRVGHPDLVVVNYSAMINDADGIYLTRADCVQDWPLKFCVAYEVDGQTTREVPLKLEKVQPVYRDKTYSWRLWDGLRDLSDPLRTDAVVNSAREAYLREGFKSLPNGMREFVKDHNEYVGKPILGISIGPRRGQTIEVPFYF